MLVMDLIRLQSRIEADNVEKYAGKKPDVLRSDFLSSLLAAHRPAEIMEQLTSVNLNSYKWKSPPASYRFRID